MAMNKLPINNYQWVDLTIEDIPKIDCEGDTGYLIECDLQYDDQLHDAHNDFPLAPELASVSRDELSEYFKDNCPHRIPVCFATRFSLLSILFLQLLLLLLISDR